MDKRPNVLIFMTDQQRWDVAQSSHICKTPNLDKLAKEGIRFNRVYTTMAHCCPARASLMTGLYPSQHGIFNNVSNTSSFNKSLNPGVETFSERLKDAGYFLYYSGKWHVSATENPVDRGWEELYVKAGKDAKMGVPMNKWPTRPRRDKLENRSRGEVLKPGWGVDRLYGILNESRTNEPIVKGYESHQDYKVIKCAVDKLDEIKNDKDNNNPWCLYVGVHGPHAAFVIPEKYAKMYNPEDIELPPNYRDEMEDKPYYYRRMRKRWSQLSEDEVKESIAYYYGYCTMLDDMLGEVLNKIEEMGEMDNTLIIFLSDHGEMLGSHGLYYKGVMPFEEGYRIPLVLKWTKGIKNPGREVDQLVSIMDIAPTLIDVVGAEKLSKQGGRSLMPFILDEQDISWRDALYMQCNGVEVYVTQRIVRTDRYKFIYSPFLGDELYDLEQDPFETINHVDDPAYAEVKKEMIRKMWELALESDDNTICNPYSTISLLDYGPMWALCGEERNGQVE